MRSLMKGEGRVEVEEKGHRPHWEGGSPSLVSQSPVSGKLPPVMVSVAVPEEGFHEGLESEEGPHADCREGPHHHD